MADLYFPANFTLIPFRLPIYFPGAKLPDRRSKGVGGRCCSPGGAMRGRSVGFKRGGGREGTPLRVAETPQEVSEEDSTELRGHLAGGAMVLLSSGPALSLEMGTEESKLDSLLLAREVGEETGTAWTGFSLRGTAGDSLFESEVKEVW